MKAFVLALAFAFGAAAVRADIKIRFQGNAGLGKRKLMEVIDPEPPDYDKAGLQSWREDAEFYLIDLYRSIGYFDAAVRTDLSPRGKDPRDWDAVFSIQEGPRYVYDTVVIRGARLREGATRLPSTRDSAAGPTATVSAPAALAPAAPPVDSGSAPIPLNPRPPAPDTGAVPLVGPALDTSELEARPGKPFRQDALLADRRALMRRYGDAGFVRVEADDRIDIRGNTKTVKVEYLIDPGEPVVFDTLEVRDMRAPPKDTLPGLTREELIQDLVPYARGDTMRMSSNDKLIEKLQYTGAYNFVRIKDSLRPGAGGRSTMYLYAEEHVPGSLRSSLFYETQYGPGFSVDGRHSNVAGTLNELRSGFSFAYELQTLYAGFGSPLIMGTLVRFDDDVDLKWDQSDQNVAFDEGPLGGTFTWTNSSRLTWPHSYWLRLVTDAELEAKSRMVSADSRERDLSLNFIQTAFVTFVDQAMDPTRGVRLAFTWGNGGALQKNDVFRFAEYRHNWIEAKTSHYYPLPGLRMLKPATRLDGGRFFGQGGPNSDRFFLGGSRSVRSYGFQNLCPMGPNDSVCVAQDSILAYVQAGAELRFEPLWFLNPRGRWHSLAPLQIVPFYDFGKVWDVRHGTHFTWKGKPPSGEGYASGLGVRYPLLGIFNLRMDFVLKGSGGHFFWLDLAQAF